MVLTNSGVWAGHGWAIPLLFVASAMWSSAVRWAGQEVPKRLHSMSKIIEACLGHLQDKQIDLHTPARILEVYVKAVAGFSPHVDCPDGLKNTSCEFFCSAFVSTIYGCVLLGFTFFVASA